VLDSCRGLKPDALHKLQTVPFNTAGFTSFDKHGPLGLPGNSRRLSGRFRGTVRLEKGRLGAGGNRAPIDEIFISVVCQICILMVAGGDDQPAFGSFGN